MIIATHEDNMMMMSRYADNYFDLAIPDPQYGIGESSKNHKSRSKIARANNYTSKKWDDKPPNTRYFELLKSKSKNQIIFGANYFSQIVSNTFLPPRRADYESFIKNNPVGFVIWDKMNGKNDFNDCEIIYTSFNIPSFIVKYMWHGMMQGKSVNSNEQIGNKKLNEKRIHPTQKPVKLYEWILLNYAKKGDKILDTHRGSGSIDIACHNLGFNLVTCENDKDIFEDANKRFKNHTRQQRISF